jgi:hypothetical protein
MLSRSDRHRKNNKESAWPIKRLFGWIAAGAVICLILVLGGVYLASSSNPAKEQADAPLATTAAEKSPKPIASVSPSPSMGAAATPSSVPAKPAAIPSTKPVQTQLPQAPLTGAQVKLSFVGDVIFSSRVEDQLKKSGYDYPYTFVKEYLQNADYTIANLETPVTERGDVQKKEYVYRSSPLALPAFKEAGIDLVNLANNHVMDYGAQGLLDTFDALKKADIKYIGARMPARRIVRSS